MKKFILFLSILSLLTSPAYAGAGSIFMKGGAVGSSVNNNFVTSWDMTKTGTSGTRKITLPLVSGGTYNFHVDWGDSSSNDITTWNDANKLHTYAGDGPYTVTISPNGTVDNSLIGWVFNNGSDCQRLVGVSNWGFLRVGTSQGYYFYGCSNMVVTATDSLNTSNVTNMGYMFHGCSVFNQSLGSNFNTANVTNMESMFYICSAFNQSLGSNFNTANVTNMGYMFAGSGWTKVNYDAALILWGTTYVKTTPNPMPFHAGTAKYTLGGAAAAARAALISVNYWSITDGGGE